MQHQRGEPSREHQVAGVLQLVEQHADLDNLSVLRLLRVTSGVRTALQQAVSRMVLGRRTVPALNTAQRLAEFARWLPLHSGLVSDLTFSLPEGVTARDHPWQIAADEAQSALLLCSVHMPLARLQPRSGSLHLPTPAVQAAALQLTALITNCVHCPVTLGTLSSCSSLVKLTVQRVTQESLNVCLFKAFMYLTSLTELCVGIDSTVGALDADIAVILGRLTQLEVCHITGSSGVPLSSLPRLPVSLRDLRLGVQEGAAGAAATAAAADVSHLSNLAQLYLTIPGGLSASSQLPSSLTALTLVGPAEAVGGLEELQSLEVHNCYHALPLLGRLPGMPALRQVKVGLGRCQTDQADAVFAAIAAATALTRLHVFSIDPREMADRYCGSSCHGVWLHRHLRQLRQLRVLRLSGLDIGRVDAMKLTALSTLSSLTDLGLSCCAISDVGYGAIMQALTGLRSLTLQGSGSANPMMWVPVACLTNLQSFTMTGLAPEAELNEETLHLLSALNALSYLEIDCWCGQPVIPPEECDAFLAGMPLLNDFNFTCVYGCDEQ